MVVYNFKTIQVVPTAGEFVDVVLSKTNRKTPTVVHKGYAISRIRKFYMRKVKFTQQTIHDKLSHILSDFPLLDEIHPFYADLMNVLYDKDHYKLALGQLNMCKHLIDKLGKDYARLLKYGDSLFRCKQLKRAALGRMVTLLKKQHANLGYLEQVRQHLSRLPAIDPNARTLLICGYPNVGKSSFMNKITRAEVEVQPYAFTTKSLFVGHTDYNYLRWQVIDTPGILDHPLEERNTIEMQSITALAHLNAAILYFVDISEQCGYTIKQQISLFKSIQPLFINKPLVLVANKVDVVQLDKIDPVDRQSLIDLSKQRDVSLIEMSNHAEVGVMNVRNTACDLLLELRVETKMKSKTLKGTLNKIHVAVPKPRDSKIRESFVPQTVLEQRSGDDMQVTPTPVAPRGVVIEYRDTEEIEPLDPATFIQDWRKGYMLKDDDWKYDAIPEIVEGYNVADFYDPEIEEILDRLEKEEEEELQRFEEAMKSELEPFEELDEEQVRTVLAIRRRNQSKRLENLAKFARGRPAIPRKFDASHKSTIGNMESHLKEMGIDPSLAVERARSESRSRTRGRSMERSSSTSRVREVSVSRGEGYRDILEKKRAMMLTKKIQKEHNKDGRKGEADRHVYNLKPKHMMSGKRGLGTHSRR